MSTKKTKSKTVSSKKATPKTAMPKKAKAKKVSNTSKKANNRFNAKKFVVWFLITLAKVFFVLLFVLLIYSIYLDTKVRAKFDGQRWEVPVQVFGKAEVFETLSPINVSALSDSLTFSGYKRVNQVTRAGEFSMTNAQLFIFRKPFSLRAEMQSANKIQIGVSNHQITQLLLDNVEVNSITLAPVLMSRILPNNKEDRVLTALNDVPTLLLDTLLLVEDRDFYFHKGISPIGILRAFYTNVMAGKTVQGGSTLTQQLIKNMFLTREKTLWRKVNEAIMSLIIEYRYSKDHLLEAYINEVYLGQHYAHAIHGFGLAAEFYFGKNLALLTPAQIAMLVGIVKGPSYYDPWKKRSNAKERRDLILKMMFEKELLTKTDFINAIESPLTVREERRLTRQKFPSYMQLVKQELSKLMSDYEQQSGVSVFTGFSHYSQQLLEQTIKEQLPNIDNTNELETAMVVTHINTGEIKAMVGGKNVDYAGFNRAINANRPVGSLVKPAIYLAALERYEQFTLATILDDMPITLTADDGSTWSPENYDNEYRETVHLLDGLVQSLNIPTVNLGMKIGLKNVAKTYHLLGFNKDITLRPSMLLGSINMSPVEVNQFYLPLAANGIKKRGHAITHIVSAQDETLWEFSLQDEQLFSSQASYLINYALGKVTKEGTARSLTWRLSNKEVLGKTGTTNEQRDSWFVGYDNKHLVTAWVGRDDNKPTQLTGSSGALILFANYMKKQGVVDKVITPPEGVLLVPFDKTTGQAVAKNCGNTVILPANRYFIQQLTGCGVSEKTPNKPSWLERLFGN